MPKISVIIPVYNEEKYLGQCLDSLRYQTLADIEIICVDDGSTDSSPLILRNYEKLDKRIKVINQKNQYAGVARNNGMKHATGKYLLFLDSDDFFELDMLEKMFLRAEEEQLDIVLCHYNYLDNRNGRKFENDFEEADSLFPKGVKVFSGTEIKHAGIFQSMVGWAWDKLFRADFVKETGYEFPNSRSSNDGFFVYMHVARAKRIGVLEDRLVWHRMFDETSLSNTREKSWENGFRMIEMIYKELVKQGLYSQYEQSFISWAVKYQVWYLTTLFEKDAFLKAYQYIKEYMEPEFRALQYQGNLLCEQKRVEYYNWIITLDPEQFLLRRIKEWDDIRNEQIKKNLKKGWVFPYEKIPKNVKLVIYGAGVVGQSYYYQLKATSYCEEIHIVDQNYQMYNTEDYPVQSVETLKDIDFDYILVAISNDQIKTEVLKTLNEKYNIPVSKMV